MKERLINLLLAMLRWLKYDSHGIHQGVLEAARIATREAERKGGEKSGEAKRAQALRMMMNLCPGSSHREIALAIELCLPR
jgi:hypothetical protein